MATYGTLKDRVLRLTEQIGVVDAGEVAKIALEEVVKYVSTKVVLPQLIGSATYTWQSSDTSASIAADFGVSDYETPVRLYVDDVPYEYREFLVYKDLKSVPLGYRDGISSEDIYDERPQKCWTVNFSNEIELDPVSTGAVLQLYYAKPPASYSDAGTPELPARFDHILVTGAVLVLKEYLREPEQIIDYYTLFSALDNQIRELDIALNSLRKRNVIKIHPRYRVY